MRSRLHLATITSVLWKCLLNDHYSYMDSPDSPRIEADSQGQREQIDTKSSLGTLVAT